MKDKIYIDTCSIINSGFDFNGEKYKELVYLIEEGQVQTYTSDITIY